MTSPLSVIKYCMKCGSDKFIPDSDKSFKCKGCGFHFFVNSASAVAALILNTKGELLLTVRASDPNKGMLDLPGGFVDPGESAEDAVKREIFEELGLKTGNIKYLVSFPNEYIFSAFTVHTVDMAFIAEVQDFSDIEARDDVADFLFVDPEKIDRKKIFSDSIRKIIDYFIDTPNTGN